MGAKLGGGGGSKYVVEANSDLNVTPLVDVMLVLLIIFMVAAPMATVSIKLDLPPAVPPQNLTEKPPEPTYISIQNGGRLFISVGTGGNTETSLATLAGDLAGRIGGAAPQEERVFVRAQADVVYEDFMAVMNTLQENGFYKVGLLSEDIE